MLACRTVHLAIRALAALSLSFVVLGCRQQEGGDAPRPPVKLQPTPPKITLDLRPGAPKRASRFTRDPLWSAAAQLGEIQLLRLADREGAGGLMEGLAEGRSVALTALAALPYASDAALALPKLCSRDGLVTQQPSLPVLTSIQGISGQPPQPQEPVAPGARPACLSSLQELLKRGGLAPALHDLASSAAELLREHRDAARH
jgi:hypothetical protein